MRNSRFERLISVILAAVLLISAFAVTTAFAEEAAGEEEPVVTAPSVQIKYANLNYASRTEIAYAVEAVNLGENDRVVMLYWDAEQAEEDYVYEKALYRRAAYDVDVVEGVECHLFLSKGVVPADFNEYVYARPVIKTATVVDGEINYTYTYGDVLKYNIAAYAADSLAKAGITEAQKNLYQALLKYSDATANKFGGAEPVYTVVTSNAPEASFGKACAKFAVPDANGKVLARAEATNAAGKYFIKWVDAEGNTLATDRLANIPVSDKGYVYVTPVYGDLADSVYTEVYAFESLPTGELAINKPAATKTPNLKPFGTFTGTAFMALSEKTTFGKLSLSSIFAPTFDTDTEGKEKAEWYAPIKDENGNYTIASYDKYVINESNGDKQLYVDRSDHPSNGWGITLDRTTNDAKGFEFDIAFDSLTTGDSAPVNFTINIKDTTSGLASVGLRTNFNFNDARTAFNLYAEGNRETGKTFEEDGKTVKTYAYKPGETITLKLVLRLGENIDNSYIDYYINGEYFAPICLNQFTSIAGKAYDMGTAYVYTFASACVGGMKDNVTYDNLAFLK